MNFSESFVKIPIFLVFLLFPLAQDRFVVSGVPIYVLEALTMFAGAAFLFGLWKGGLHMKPVPKGISWGASLIFLGAVTSAFAGGVDSQELGALKSWMAFPMVFAFLVFQSVSGTSEKKKALFLWFSGVAIVSLTALFVPVLSQETYDGRLRSFFPSPNHLAMVLVPGVVIGSFFLIHLFTSRRIWSSMASLFTILMLPVVIATLLKTESLGGAISCVAGLFVFLLFSFFRYPVARRGALLAVSLLAVVAIVITSTINWGGLADGEVRTSLGSRVMIWNASLTLIAEHPVSGIGMRNFERTYLALQPLFPPYLEWAVPHPHNILLAFWLFTGIAGLFGFLMLLVASIRLLLIRLSSNESDHGSRYLGSLFLALLAAFLAQGLVDTPYFRNDLAFFFWATIALAASLKSGKNVRS